MNCGVFDDFVQYIKRTAAWYEMNLAVLLTLLFALLMKKRNPGLGRNVHIHTLGMEVMLHPSSEVACIYCSQKQEPGSSLHTY